MGNKYEVISQTSQNFLTGFISIGVNLFFILYNNPLIKHFLSINRSEVMAIGLGLESTF